MTKEEIKGKTLSELIEQGAFSCGCGKEHNPEVRNVYIENDAIRRLPALLTELGCRRPFLLSGEKSYKAAGERVCSILQKAGIPYGQYVFPHSPVTPAEHAVGAAVMHFEYGCDAVIGIGSGVINDIGKILARATDRPYLIVATAPSMDGFASGTSSMERDNLKVSLDSRAAWAIIGDLNILCEAPLHMLQAGVGDMLAKYVSLAEWRIAGILVGEYTCETVIALVDSALHKVVDAAPGLLKREPDAVASVMEGMVIAGLAMKYAGVSRPASGMEHYYSHIWDMRSLAFSEAKADLHGIQCGIGTLLSLRAYEYLRTVAPERNRARKAVCAFSLEDWNHCLREFIGPGAEIMIAGETIEQKYSVEKHAVRLERIIDHWDEIVSIINSMPSSRSVYELMTSLGMPTDAGYLGYTDEMLKTCFAMTKDIRDKYIGSRLAWDLGVLEETAEASINADKR